MLPTITRRGVPALFSTDEFDRFFNLGLGGTRRPSGWMPAVDVSENGDNYLVTAELPGLSADQVEVKVENGVLSISGEKVESRNEGDEDSNSHVTERVYGRFQRSFTLPRSVDTGKVEAKFDNGVLNVTLPKAATAKPRTIEIKG